MWISGFLNITLSICLLNFLHFIFIFPQKIVLLSHFIQILKLFMEHSLSKVFSTTISKSHDSKALIAKQFLIVLSC